MPPHADGQPAPAERCCRVSEARLARLQHRLSITQSMLSDSRSAACGDNNESQLLSGLTNVLRGFLVNLEDDVETATSTTSPDDKLDIGKFEKLIQAPSLSVVAAMWKKHLETTPHIGCLGLAAEFKRWASVTPEASGCNFHAVSHYLRSQEAALESSRTPTSTSMDTPRSADLDSTSMESGIPFRPTSSAVLQLELLLRNEQKKAKEQEARISQLEHQLREQTMRSVHAQVRLTELRRTQCALLMQRGEDSETADLTERLWNQQKAIEMQQESSALMIAALKQEIEKRAQVLQIQSTRNRYLEGELRCLEASSTSELKHMSATMQMHKETISRLEGVVEDSMAVRFAESYAFEAQTHELKARVGLLEAALAQSTEQTASRERTEVQKDDPASDMQVLVSGQREWVTKLLSLLEPPKEEGPKAEDVEDRLTSLRHELRKREAALLKAEASLRPGCRAAQRRCPDLLAPKGSGLEAELWRLRQELQMEQRRHAKCEARLQQEVAAFQEERASRCHAEGEQAMAETQLFDECLAAERQLHAETRAAEQTHVASLQAELEIVRRDRAKLLARRRSDRRAAAAAAAETLEVVQPVAAQWRGDHSTSSGARPRSERRSRHESGAVPADEVLRRRRRSLRSSRQERRPSATQIPHYVSEGEEEQRASSTQIPAVPTFVGEEEEGRRASAAQLSTLQTHPGVEEEEGRLGSATQLSTLQAHAGGEEEEAGACIQPQSAKQEDEDEQ